MQPSVPLFTPPLTAEPRSRSAPPAGPNPATQAARTRPITVLAPPPPRTSLNKKKPPCAPPGRPRPGALLCALVRAAPPGARLLPLLCTIPQARLSPGPRPGACFGRGDGGAPSRPPLAPCARRLAAAVSLARGRRARSRALLFAPPLPICGCARQPANAPRASTSAPKAA
ncbi:MAG: hypothetical protein J3K34DRAFT_446332 [Monoraphidium minutum]|nr:MAG: hypothetical protein J3K34DRAFT_446332 [Monoraphidium minutum]